METGNSKLYFLDYGKFNTSTPMFSRWQVNIRQHFPQTLTLHVKILRTLCQMPVYVVWFLNQCLQIDLEHYDYQIMYAFFLFELK